MLKCLTKFSKVISLYQVAKKKKNWKYHNTNNEIILI